MIEFLRVYEGRIIGWSVGAYVLVQLPIQVSYVLG